MNRRKRWRPLVLLGPILCVVKTSRKTFIALYQQQQRHTGAFVASCYWIITTATIACSQSFFSTLLGFHLYPSPSSILFEMWNYAFAYSNKKCGPFLFRSRRRCLRFLRQPQATTTTLFSHLLIACPSANRPSVLVGSLCALFLSFSYGGWNSGVVSFL